ncbi:MAG: response regulator [Proteobacteria bacterium]|nr:response regulator [Pseudomonadota bacterium]
MKSLIVEDEFTSRLLLQEILSPYGEVHIAINGREAVAAFQLSIDANQRYDLICLDIMMPRIDGHQVLQQIRYIEEQEGLKSGERTKVIMTTALKDKENVETAFKEKCDAYMVKPLYKDKVIEHLKDFKLI